MSARFPRAVLAAALAVSSLGLFALTMQPAYASDVADTGWWSKLRQGGADAGQVVHSLVPPPPPGGLAVGADPEGANAISAVRITLDADETDPVLTLYIADSSFEADADGVVLLACHAGSEWNRGTNQEWSAKPSALCDPASGGGSVTGQRDLEAGTWTFPLGPLQLGSLVDVVLVPATGGPPSWRADFERVSDDDVRTTSVAAPTTPTTLSNTPTTQFRPTVTTSPAPPPTFTRRPAPVVSTPQTAPPAQTFTPALEPADQVLTPSAPVLQPNATVDPNATEDKPTSPWVRAAAGAQSLAAVALGWSLWRDEEEIDDEVRGLGPFASVRTGEVPRL